MTSDPVWTFQRDEDVIVLRCPSASSLVLSSPYRRVTRRIHFESAAERVNFQSGFEAYLLDTRWTLVSFVGARDGRRERWWRRWFTRT